MLFDGHRSNSSVIKTLETNAQYKILKYGDKERIVILYGHIHIYRDNEVFHQKMQLFTFTYTFMKHKLTNSLLSENYYYQISGIQKHLKGFRCHSLLPKSFEITLISINIIFMVLYFTLGSCNTLFTGMDIFYKKVTSNKWHSQIKKHKTFV